VAVERDSWLVASLPIRVISASFAASRAIAAERGTADGRETNSTPTSSARSDGTPVIFSKPSSKPQQILR
jgi:hypothetical protein